MPQAASQTPGIFICYRRDDSAGHAGRLHDRLTAHFGDEQVFMDLDQIEPGEDFVQAIVDAVGSCEILLALIGRNWLTSRDGANRRLDNPNDFVRLELAAALACGVCVIPVLVQGALMPRAQDLPEDLLSLSRRNAYELSDLRWKHDVEQLISVLEKVLARRGEEKGQSQARETSQPQPTDHLKPSDSYEPDATAIQILTMIEKQICWEGEIASNLKIEPKQVNNSLKLLEEHGYIRVHRPGDTAPYCELTQKGSDFLNKPVYKFQFHPSGRLDEASERLLTLLADPKCNPHPTPLGKASGLHPVRVHVLLTKLSERGYVAHNSYHRMTGEPGFCLTHLGREYLINNNLVN